jgi:hypothetical protein
MSSKNLSKKQTKRGFRIYFVDYPGPFFHHACSDIVSTAHSHYAFGGSELTTCEQLKNHNTCVVVEDENQRRAQIISKISAIVSSFPYRQLRISVYTNDEELAKEVVRGGMDLISNKGNVDFFQRFSIVQSGKDVREYGCVLCGMKHGIAEDCPVVYIKRARS